MLAARWAKARGRRPELVAVTVDHRITSYNVCYTKLLRKQAQWLTNYSQYTFTVEGHADERGTREYNLALGARRAQTVRDYLISRGIAANRMSYNFV